MIKKLFRDNFENPTKMLNQCALSPFSWFHSWESASPPALHLPTTLTAKLILFCAKTNSLLLKLVILYSQFWLVGLSGSGLVGLKWLQAYSCLAMIINAENLFLIRLSFEPTILKVHSWGSCATRHLAGVVPGNQTLAVYKSMHCLLFHRTLLDWMLFWFPQYIKYLPSSLLFCTQLLP